MTTIDKTGASDAEFRARVAPFEAAPFPAEVLLAHLASPAPSQRDRYAQCDDTCTVDCRACKGAGPS